MIGKKFRYIYVFILQRKLAWVKLILTPIVRKLFNWKMSIKMLYLPSPINYVHKLTTFGMSKCTVFSAHSVIVFKLPAKVKQERAS